MPSGMHYPERANVPDPTIVVSDPDGPFIRPVLEHEGNKYVRQIMDVKLPVSVNVDVYSVIVAFNVTCPGRQQALKKLLCSGLRGKGSELDDLQGALAAVLRAIDLQKQKETKR